MTRHTPTPFSLPVIGIAVLACLLFVTGSYMIVRHIQGYPSPQMQTLLQRDAQKTFNARHYTLDNGLDIVVIPNHRAPVVTHMVWYKVGSADEKTGHSGIAHFLEHLMFKGSEGLAPGEFSKTVRSLGGEDNAFTSRDYTAYYQSIAAEHLPQIMAMEAGRMRGLNPPENELLSERAVILEERRQRIDNAPPARLSEQMRASAFINHPYGTPVIGWLHEMEQLEWPMIKAFYDHHYGPNNAILVVTGDVTGDEVLALARQTYGRLSPIELPPRDWTQSPPLAGHVSVNMQDPTTRQPQISFLIRVPSARQDKQTALALELIQEIMGGGSSARLYQALVVQQKLATAIDFSYDSAAREDASLWISAYPAPGIEPDMLKRAIEVQLHKLAQNGVSAAELKTAKQKAKDSAIFARDSLSGPAMIIGRALSTGSTLEDIEYWPRDIGRIEAKTVQAVAQQFLDPDNPHVRMAYGTLTPTMVAPQTREAP